MATDYDAEHTMGQLLEALLAADGVEQLTGLSIGQYDAEPFDKTPGDVAETMLANAAKLPALRTLIWCDLAYEECEVSWIENIELGPLLNTFPQLEHVLVRGGNNLGLSNLDLPELRTLIIQTGGLDQSVIRQLEAAKLPKLTHLEIYFGADEYGANCTPDDTARILSGELFPGLTTLGLKNSEFVNEITQAVIDSPLLPQLKVLDLSLGVLQDAGAEPLANNLPKLAHLDKLDLQHHFLSESMQARLRELGDKVDLSEAEEPDEDYFFVAIGE
ncbi:MAG: hypothetical protein GXX86_01365 [Propionibacterium sp.]|nr:hypothetical protein [Propionibacterium sp.]